MNNIPICHWLPNMSSLIDNEMKESKKQNYDYLAFISYQRKDEAIAKRLQHTLEFYNLPIAVIEKHPEHPELKEGIRPIFVDMTELGDEPFLEPAIKKNLKGSKFLIVICSPRSAKSKWVNKEVEYFLQHKRTKRIIPFIIEGTPNAQVEDDECCTPLLKTLLGERELLGINISEMGFDAAAVKVVSRMFRVKFSTLWNRYEKEKEEEQRKLKEQNDRLLIAQSRFIAEKAEKLLSEGDSNLSKLLALKVLPKDVSNPDRPYTPEAEFLLRNAESCNCSLLKSDETLSIAKFSPDGKHIIASLDEYTYSIWDFKTGECINTNLNQSFSKYVSFSSDGRRIVSTMFSSGDICIWDAETNKLLQVIKTREENIRYVEYINRDKDLLIKTDSYTIIWCIKKRKIIKTDRFVSYNPTGSAICIKEKLCCCIREGNHIVVKDLYTDAIIFERVEQENYPVCCVTISSNGKLVGYVIKTKIRIYDIQKDILVFELDNVPVPVVSLRINSECDTLAVGYFNKARRGIDIWDMVQKKLFVSFQAEIDKYSTMDFAQDNKTILVCHPHRNCIKMVDYKKVNGKISKKGHGNSVVAWGVDNEEQLAVTADCMGVVTLWNIKQKSKLLSIDTTLHDISHLTVSAKDRQIVIVSGTDVGFDGKYLLRMEQNNESIHGLVTVWEGEGNLINISKRLESFSSKVIPVSDGHWLVAEYYHDVIIYKKINNCYKKTWLIEDVELSFMTSNRNGNIIAISSCKNCSIEVFNIETHEHINSFDCGGANPTCISISPMENFIAAGLENGFIHVWDLRTNELVSMWKSSSSMVKSIVFSFDEEKLISYASIKLNAWDVKTGRKVQIIDDNVGLEGGIGVYKQSLSFVNNQTILLATMEGINFYTFKPLQELIDETQKEIGARKLSNEECIQYYLE